MDDLENLLQPGLKWHYIVPSFMFSEARSLSYLTPVPPLLVNPYLYIILGYTKYFRGQQPIESTKFGIDSRTYAAIESLSQTQNPSGGSDLSTIALRFVFQQFMGNSRPRELQRVFPNPHHQWLSRMKPMKHISQGSPKLSSAFYSYPSTRRQQHITPKRYRKISYHAHKISSEKVE